MVDKYGDALVCVRYRYDELTGIRIKTVELVVERKVWTPPPTRFAPHELVPVHIAFKEDKLKQMAKAAGGRWDPVAKLWFIPYGKICNTTLEKHLILDARGNL